jgi:hypothetical protein
MVICRLRLNIAHGKCWSFALLQQRKKLKGAKIESARVDWVGQKVILSKPSQNKKAIGI